MFRKIALGTSLLAVSIGANSCFADEPKADLNSVEHNDERHLKQFRIDQRFPANLPNQPFSIDAYVPIGDQTGDPIHRFYHQQAQTDGGLMDRFVAYSNMGPLVMGFYDGSKTKLWEYAQHYTLADHFFHAAFGGSSLNHFWMICACTPRYDNAPDTLKVREDPADPLRGLPDQVTLDGYAVNTLQPFDPPRTSSSTTPSARKTSTRAMPTCSRATATSVSCCAKSS